MENITIYYISNSINFNFYYHWCKAFLAIGIVAAIGIPINDEYDQCWKKFVEHRDVRKCGIEQCYGVKHDRTKIFIAFKMDSRKSYTSYRLNPDQSLNHDKNNTIGKNYKN